MATRTFSGTLDTLEHEGSEITYKGSTDACDRSENIRGFQVNPGSTGDIIVKLDRSIGIKSVEIFQEDEYAASSAPTGYTGFSDIEQSGKGKGAVAMTVTNAAKNYLVIFKTDGYSEVTFGGTVDVPYIRYLLSKQRLFKINKTLQSGQDSYGFWSFCFI